MSVVYQYQEPATPVQQDPKFRKKLLLLIALIVGLVIVMVLVAVFGVSRNVQQQAEAPKSKAEQFVTAVADNNTEQIKQLSTFKTELTDDEVIKNGDPLEELRGFANLKTCRVVKSSASSVEFSCDRTKEPSDTTVYKRVFRLALNQEQKVSGIDYEPITDN